MAEEDGRAEEMEMIQAMFCQEGEFTLETEVEFAFTLRLSVGEAPSIMSLEAQLPQGYPKKVPPELRIICDDLSREGQDTLNAGVKAQVEELDGEPCIAAIAAWLQEFAPEHLIAPKEDAAPEEEVKERRKGLRFGAKCTFWEERGDLFDVGTEWALCHCVSKDLEMSAGIAVDFRKNFSGVEDLKRQQVDVGGVGVLQKKGRFVYYLVTKNKHGGKPNIETLRATLVAMKERIVADGVKKLAMPHIGCGLDRLSWGTVQDLVMEIFDDLEIELLARAL